MHHPVDTGGCRRAMGWFAAQLRARFYLGQIGAGDRLPSVRGLAEDLGVSPTTTLELYRSLESQGVVEGRQRSGMFLRTLGVEPERSQAKATLFRLIAATANRLRLTGVRPDDFATLLLRYMGQSRRTDFRVAFIGSEESLELIQRQLAARLRFSFPIVRIPQAVPRAELRARIAAIRHVRCLLATVIDQEDRLGLARELDLPLVVVRLAPETAEILQPPRGERRFIVVRDRDTAEGLRRQTCAICHAERRSSVCPALLGQDHVGLPCEAVGTERRPFVQFAALDEEARLSEFAREAEVVHAPITSIVAVKARFKDKRLASIPVTLSDQTVNDIMYHYMFAEPLGDGSAGCRHA